MPAAALGRAGCRCSRARTSLARRPPGTGPPTSAPNAELAELRGAVSALRGRVAELERDAAQACEREGQLRAALYQLAAAGVRQRRRLTAELRGRGLL